MVADWLTTSSLVDGLTAYNSNRKGENDDELAGDELTNQADELLENLDNVEQDTKYELMDNFQQWSAAENEFKDFNGHCNHRRCEVQLVEQIQ